VRLSAFLANRWRPAHAIERSTSHRFGMTAHPVCPGGFSIIDFIKIRFDFWTAFCVSAKFGSYAARNMFP